MNCIHELMSGEKARDINLRSLSQLRHKKAALLSASHRNYCFLWPPFADADNEIKFLLEFM